MQTFSIGVVEGKFIYILQYQDAKIVIEWRYSTTSS